MKTITATQKILVAYRDGHKRLTTFGDFCTVISHEEDSEQSRMIESLVNYGETYFCSIKFQAVNLTPAVQE